MKELYDSPAMLNRNYENPMRYFRRLFRHGAAAAGLLALFLLGSCASVGQGGIQGVLDAARQRWRSDGLDNYSYRYERSCFCPPEIVRPVIIIVRNDAVDSVFYADTRQ